MAVLNLDAGASFSASSKTHHYETQVDPDFWLDTCRFFESSAAVAPENVDCLRFREISCRIQFWRGTTARPDVEFAAVRIHHSTPICRRNPTWS